MNATQNPELYYLTLSAALTAVIWIPIILNRLREKGVWPAVSNPVPDLQANALWATRADAAHRNAIENLVVFAPLALSVHVLQLGDNLTGTFAMAYFVSRLVHLVVYMLGVPVARTLAFAVCFSAQMVFAGRLLGIV